MTTTSAAQSATLEVNGLRLHYLDWGAPRSGALPLVILHGLTGSAAAMARVGDHFASRYHVVALDQRGHGESEHSGERAYHTSNYVSDLGGFVDALGFERFALLGHSMGGHNTIAFTARHPDRIAAAIANDIPPRLDWNRDEILGRYADAETPTPEVFPDVDAWIASQDSPFTSEEQFRISAAARLEEVDGGVRLKADPWASIEWAPDDLWDAFRSIERPLLLVRGGRSPILDAQTLQDMDMALDSARSITLEKSGHNTFADMEHEFLDIVGAFLAAHGG
jgi:pimeloyl-ACP methyl ester carboxylesterase